MSDEQAIDAFIEAFNARDVDRALAFGDTDFVISTADEWPGGGTYEGPERVRAFLEEFLEPWQEIRYEYEHREQVGARFVERGRWVGRGRASGAPSAVDFYTCWSVNDGLITRMDVFARRLEALECARGLGG